ncbi:MAG TPA: alpha/beta hydrolase [Vicinamibacteria bacterium]
MPAWLPALLAVAIGAGDPDGNFIVPGTKGAIVYRRVDGQVLRLDAYAQRGGGLRPAVVVIHGGNWTAGSRIAHVGQLLETLTRAGYNWLSLDYRLGGPDRRDQALDDVRAALAFVRAHATELRIDPERIALLGEDAGADLAATLSAERPSGVRAAALVGGLYDSGDTSRTGEARPGRPDTLVVHGERDTEVPPARARRFCDGVVASGSRCDVQIVDGAIHRAENWLPTQWAYKDALVKWLAARLGQQRPAHQPYPTRLQKDVVYDAQRGLKLDAWTPSGRGPFPAVILAHGGGWEAGDKVTYITPLFEPLARAGFAWFSIDYRLTPQVRHPEQIDDLRRAVAFVKSNSRRFHIDPRRIAVVGESASGQMAALLATQDSTLTAAVSFYGVYDFAPLLTETSPGSRLDKLFGLREIDDPARELIRRYSPIHHVTKAMPPLLLIHGTNERLWAQGLAMRDRLREVGARHELFALEGAPHGMENWEGRPEWAGYKTKLVEWLTQQLGGRP